MLRNFVALSVICNHQQKMLECGGHKEKKLWDTKIDEWMCPDPAKSHPAPSKTLVGRKLETLIHPKFALFHTP